MRLLFIVCILSLLPFFRVLPRSSVEESPACFGGAVPVAVVDGFGGGFRHRLQRLTTTHGGEIVPNFGTIPGRRLRHSVVCSVMGAARPGVQLSGIVEGAALLLCQFLVQSICRPQRLAVVVDVIQRVLTAFLRRVCNWAGKLSAERFSGDCGAILTPYACARFLAPRRQKLVTRVNLVHGFGFAPGEGL